MQTDQAKQSASVSDVLTARKAAVGTLAVNSFATSPLTLTFLTNAQVISTVTSDNSQILGNMVFISINVSLDMQVDFNSYPVLVGHVPLSYAPLNGVFLPVCLDFPPAPTPGVFVLEIKTNGDIYTCPTGLPFPVGVYQVSASASYIIS